MPCGQGSTKPSGGWKSARRPSAPSSVSKTMHRSPLATATRSARAHRPWLRACVSEGHLQPRGCAGSAGSASTKRSPCSAGRWLARRDGIVGAPLHHAWPPCSSRRNTTVAAQARRGRVKPRVRRRSRSVVEGLHGRARVDVEPHESTSSSAARARRCRRRAERLRAARSRPRGVGSRGSRRCG